MRRAWSHLCLVLLLTALSAGCRMTSRSLPVDPGSGKPVALWLLYPDRDEPVVLEAPYAIAIFWQGDDRRFYLFDAAARRVYKTTHFPTFIRKLDGLPAAAAVQHITICSSGLAYDMPEGKWTEIQNVMDKAGRTWAPNPTNHLPLFIVCTCESRGLRFP